MRQYLIDDEDMDCYGQMVFDNSPDDGICSQTILECILTEILNEDIKYVYVYGGGTGGGGNESLLYGCDHI